MSTRYSKPFDKTFGDIREDQTNQRSISQAHFMSGGGIPDSVIIEPFVTIEADVVIGENTIIGPNTFIRNGTRIGRDSVIGGNCVIEGNGVKVGDRVRIGTHCNLGFGTVIEDLVFIAGHFTGANDNRIVWQRGSFEPKPYKIEFGARIGLQCVVGADVVIGREALVGIGSVVTHDVKPRTVVFGNPATWHGFVDTKDEINYEEYDLTNLSYQEARAKYGTIIADYHHLEELHYAN